MSGYVSLDKLIDITSSSVTDAFSLSKLPTLAIRKADSIPNGEFTEVTGITSAQNLFGVSSDVAKFATKHFAVVSKNATKVDRMFVYNWAEDGQAESLRGGAITNSVMALSGDFGISLNGVVENFTVDLTSATTFAEVATALQTEIRTSTKLALANATVTYVAQFKAFVLTLAVKEEFNVSVVAGTANDIHDTLGWTTNEGVKFIEFLPARTFAEVLNRIKAVNGAYYLITTLFSFDTLTELDDLIEVGEWVHASQNRFSFLYSWANKQLLDASSGSTSSLIGFNGLIIDYPTEEYQNGYVAGLISSLNLSLVSGNSNIAFNDASIFSTPIEKDENYDGLEANRANAPVKFGILGQSDTIYMLGLIMGSLTDSINVYICNSFLKFAQQIALYNMFKSQKIISLRGGKGFGTIKLYMDEVFNNAVASNIIVTGAELTTSEKASLIDNFPNNAEKAQLEVSKFGYYYEVNRVDTVTKEMYITQAYMANMPVRKIVINSFVLGA